MPSPEQDDVLKDVEIRDTSDHNSIASLSGIFQAKTIIVHNGLNQDITLQLQGSDDAIVWLNVGDSFDVTSDTSDFETVSHYFPQFRLQASCSVAPTTGSVTAHIIKVA